MAELPRNPEPSGIPEARAQPKSRFTFQVVWLIPIVSAIIGGYIAVKAILDRGPVVAISFLTAEGLEAGKTKIKYKDVEIGVVKDVSFAKDLKRVIATTEFVKQAAPYLVEDTTFWVVRPRISGGTVTGLTTLLSGAYIGVDIGNSKNSRREFDGLETPPVIPDDTPGREFTLTSDHMPSLDNGSPVFFRKLKVGQVKSYALNSDGRAITLKIFVNEPYDKYVGANTRFWSASGFDLKLDASGLRLETESVVSILLGGLSFETPEEVGTFQPASANQTFRLFRDRTEAMKNPDTDVMRTVMVFNESARGLSAGAPIDFRGIIVGEVTAVKVDIDRKTGQVVVPVEVNIYPGRMRRAARNPWNTLDEEGRQKVISDLVARGLRGQLRTGSLVTGQLYIALDFFADGKKQTVNWAHSPVELPTTPGALQNLQTTLASVAGKIERLPLDEIGKDARTTLASMDLLLKGVHADVAPDLRRTLQSGTKLLERLDSEVTVEARATLIEARKALVSADRLIAADAPLQTDTREAMRELARAAHAFRMLADYIERNPQSLLLGKKGDGP